MKIRITPPPLGTLIAIWGFFALLSVATSVLVIVLIVMAIRWLAAGAGGAG